MVSKKRKSESQGGIKKKRKLGKPRLQERLEFHSKQLKLNEQNLRTTSELTSKNNDSLNEIKEDVDSFSSHEVSTYRKLTLNDVFNRMSHYSGKESAAGVDQLSELIRRFPNEMKIHQFDISKKLIICITEHDDAYVRTASIRALNSLFTMMKSFSFGGGGIMIEHVIIKLFISCVCSIMSDMFVRMRAFGLDMTILLINYFPESIVRHAYKLLPTLENVFLMTKTGIRHKGEDFSILHDRTLNCLGRLIHIIFQYDSKLQLDEQDIHTHCHKSINLKQSLRGKQNEISSLERENTIKEVEKAYSSVDYTNTSKLYQSIVSGKKKSLHSLLESVYKRESNVNRVNSINVTLSNLFQVDESIPESVLYSLGSSYSLYRFCDRMFGTIKDKWVETLQKGTSIQSLEQASRIKTILKLIYGILYAIEHHHASDYQKDIYIYLEDAIHYMVRCIPFTGSIEVSEKLKTQLSQKSKIITKSIGLTEVEGIEELNIYLIAVLSFVCGKRLDKKKRLQKTINLLNWESLYIQHWEEMISSPLISHSHFGILLGSFHRLQYYIPEENRNSMWSTLTKIFIEEKQLSVKQRLLLHFLSDGTLDDNLTIPNEMLIQWVNRISKMLAFIPEKKVQLSGKLLNVIASFSMKPKFHDFLNTVILESLPSFFFNFDHQNSTFSKLSFELQENAVNLLHYFSNISLPLFRSLSKVCSMPHISSRIITQILETLRFKQESVDLKAHITFLASLLAGISTRSESDQELILHEIIISLYSIHDIHKLTKILIPIISSLLDRENLDIITYFILLKVSFTIYDISNSESNDSLLWTKTIPELITDIISDKNASPAIIMKILILLQQNQFQFKNVINSLNERLNEEDLIEDVQIGFSRIMNQFDQFRNFLIIMANIAIEICNTLKQKSNSFSSVYEMESKLKFLL